MKKILLFLILLISVSSCKTTKINTKKSNVTRVIITTTTSDTVYESNHTGKGSKKSYYKRK